MFFCSLRFRPWARVLLLALAGGWHLAAAQVPRKPKANQFVLDNAQVLSKKYCTDLNNAFVDIASEDQGWHLLTLTVPSLHGRQVDTLVLQVAKAWGLLHQPKTTLLLLAPKENTGSLWHSQDLDDLISPLYHQLILEQTLRPCLRHEQDSMGLILANRHLYQALTWGSRPHQIGDPNYRELLTLPPGLDKSAVQDFAFMLSIQEHDALKRDVATCAAQHKLNIVLVTVASLCGKSLEVYANSLLREVGYIDPTSTILILVAEQERQVRIATGYSMAVSDEQAKGIIEKVLVPAFKQKRYYAGLHQALEQISTFAQQNAEAELVHKKWEGRQPWMLVAALLGFLFSLPFWARNLKGNLNQSGYRHRSIFIGGSGGGGFRGGSSGGGSLGGGASGSW